MEKTITMKKYLCAVCVLLALLVGFLFQGIRSNQRRNKSEEDESKVSRKTISPTARRGLEIRSLTKQARREGGTEEWVRWLGYLEKAKPGDMAMFLENVPANSAVLDLLAERWVELDPEHCFDYLLAKFEDGQFEAGLLAKDRSFSAELFRKWMSRDLEAAMASLDEVEGFPYAHRIRGEFFKELAKKDMEAALLYAEEYHLFSSPDGFGFINLKPWVRKNPRKAGEFLFGLSSKGLAYGLRDLVPVWSKENPQEAVEFGLLRGDFAGLEFAENIFEKWSEQSFTEAANWLAHSPAENADFLTADLIANWSKEDPVSALAWSQSSLEGTLLKNSVQEVFKEAASSDELDLGDLLSRVKGQSARDVAAATLAENYLNGKKQLSAEEAAVFLAWFEGVSNPLTFHNVVAQLGSFDGFEDGARLDTIEKILSSPQKDLLDEGGYHNLLYSLLKTDPEQVMEFALQAPEEFRAELLGGFLEDWRARQGEAVDEWIANSGHEGEVAPALAQQFLQTLHGEPAEVLAKVNTLQQGPVKEALHAQLLAMRDYAVAEGLAERDPEELKFFNEMIQATAN